MTTLILISYGVVAFVVMIVTARLIAGNMLRFEKDLNARYPSVTSPAKLDPDDYALAVIGGCVAGLLWPLAVLCLIIARFAFPHLFTPKPEATE